MGDGTLVKLAGATTQFAMPSVFGSPLLQKGITTPNVEIVH
jgi:hypothetical protein